MVTTGRVTSVSPGAAGPDRPATARDVQRRTRPSVRRSKREFRTRPSLSRRGCPRRARPGAPQRQVAGTVHRGPWCAERRTGHRPGRIEGLQPPPGHLRLVMDGRPIAVDGHGTLIRRSSPFDPRPDARVRRSLRRSRRSLPSRPLSRSWPSGRPWPSGPPPGSWSVGNSHGASTTRPKTRTADPTRRRRTRSATRRPSCGWLSRPSLTSARRAPRGGHPLAAIDGFVRASPQPHVRPSTLPVVVP